MVTRPFTPNFIQGAVIYKNGIPTVDSRAPKRTPAATGAYYFEPRRQYPSIPWDIMVWVGLHSVGLGIAYVLPQVFFRFVLISIPILCINVFVPPKNPLGVRASHTYKQKTEYSFYAVLYGVTVPVVIGSMSDNNVVVPFYHWIILFVVCVCCLSKAFRGIKVPVPVCFAVHMFSLFLYVQTSVESSVPVWVTMVYTMVYLGVQTFGFTYMALQRRPCALILTIFYTAVIMFAITITVPSVLVAAKGTLEMPSVITNPIHSMIRDANNVISSLAIFYIQTGVFFIRTHEASMRVWVEKQESIYSAYASRDKIKKDLFVCGQKIKAKTSAWAKDCLFGNSYFCLDPKPDFDCSEPEDVSVRVADAPN